MSEAEMEQETSPAEEEIKPIAGIGTLVFGKWDASQVTCKDPGLAPYINLTTVVYLTPVADTPTHGLAKQSSQSSRDTSTN